VGKPAGCPLKACQNLAPLRDRKGDRLQLSKRQLKKPYKPARSLAQFRKATSLDEHRPKNPVARQKTENVGELSRTLAQLSDNSAPRRFIIHNEGNVPTEDPNQNAEFELPHRDEEYRLDPVVFEARDLDSDDA
jgi:hypothetical protein